MNRDTNYRINVERCCTFIEGVETMNTGGNVMNDLITLKDGRVVCIFDEGLCVYPSREAYDKNELELEQMPYILDDLEGA